MTVLISLVSGQRMQNILPLFQRGMDFSKVVLIVSAEKNGELNPFFLRIAERLQDTFSNQVSWQIYSKPVDPISPNSTKVVCREIIQAYQGSEEVVVNFTGGVKPMSIGAYQAAVELGAQLLYVDTQAEQFIRYSADSYEVQAFDLLSIRVRDYLKVHGYAVDEKLTTNRGWKKGELEGGKMIFESRPESIQFAIFLHQCTIHKKPKLEFAQNKWGNKQFLFEQLVKLAYAKRTSEGWQLTKQGNQFFKSGDWLEAYVFVALRESGLFMDVVNNLYIGGVTNELDAVCMLNGKLAVVECKSNINKGSQNILNRLQALKDTLSGTFGKTFLVTGKRLENFDEPTMKRVNEYISGMICADDLYQVETLIAQKMSRRLRT